MENKKYKPLIDKLFWWIWIPTVIMLVIGTAISFVSVIAFVLLLATDIFTFYFIVTSLVGYVELREKTLFVKFGFILKREIPYSMIMGISKERKLYTDSMLSIKNSMEHVRIKYNKFDVICVSVVDNDEFIDELKKRINAN